MAGWETEIIRLFKRISEMIKPFYGDIFILNDYIRSRTVLCQDDMTQKHPIMGYWWNGIPRKSGLAVVFGEPLLKYIKISRDYESLDNGCKLFQKNKDDKKDELYRGLNQLGFISLMLSIIKFLIWEVFLVFIQEFGLLKDQN